MTPLETSAERAGEQLDSFLAERLLEAGVSDRQLASAQAYHREVEGRQPISRTLVELGLATDEAMARWIAAFYGWLYLPREELRVQGDSHTALPEAIARNRHALVLARSASGLKVAIADPSWPQFAQVRYALPRPTSPLAWPRPIPPALTCGTTSSRGSSRT
jgi:hypothetical protein